MVSLHPQVDPSTPPITTSPTPCTPRSPKGTTTPSPPPPALPSSRRLSPRSGSPFGPSVTSPGLHIWRVEKLRPVEVPKATWGVFFSGDAYLVLHNGPDERAHLHLWMGEL